MKEDKKSPPSTFEIPCSIPVLVKTGIGYSLRPPSSVLYLVSVVLCLLSARVVARPNAQGGNATKCASFSRATICAGVCKKFEYFQIFSNVSHHFSNVSTHFSNVFKRFRTFSNATCAFDATPAVLFPHVWSPTSSRKIHSQPRRILDYLVALCVKSW